MSQAGTQEIRPVLVTSLHDLRYFASLLRGIGFQNRATVKVNKTHIIIHVEEARTLLAKAWINATIFDEYAYHPEPDANQEQMIDEDEDDETERNDTVFEIQLHTLIECLNIFGTAGPVALPASGMAAKPKRWRRHGDDEEPDDRNGRGRLEMHFGQGGSEKRTGLRMTYSGAGYPLTLLIAEDASGPTTTCDLTTFEPEQLLSLEFEDDATVLKIILKSSWLRDALSELDPSVEKLTIIGNPPAVGSNKPMLRLHATGMFGSTEMDYPNDRDVLETFDCTTPVKFSYRFLHIARTLRALQSSSKTSLRIDSEGLLCLQFLMPSLKGGAAGEGSPAFLEFMCLSLDDNV